MKISHALVLIVTVAAASGCHPNHSLVGRWTEIGYHGQSEITEYTADLKVTVQFVQAKPVATRIMLSGTYTLENDNLSEVFTNASEKAIDASNQSAADQVYAPQLQALLAGANKGATGDKITWESDDRIVITDPDGTKGTQTRNKG